MRFNRNETDGRPASVPYTKKGAAVGTKWDYNAHAQLAYALMSVDDAVIPGEKEIDYAPAPIFRECCRQALIRAINENPDQMFASPKHEKAAFVSNGRNARPQVRADVSDALNRADRLVQTYFKEGVRLSPADGAKLIEDLIENRRKARYRQIEETFRVN